MTESVLGPDLWQAVLPVVDFFESLRKRCQAHVGNRISDRQWYDLQGVLRLQREALDLEHLREWAAELEVGELLEEALREGGIEGEET